MEHCAARIGLAASVVVLATVVVAWALWPAGERRADLRAVAPVATSTTTTEPPTVVAPVPTTAATAPVASGGIDPVGLRIPAIGVDARVVPVALAPDGQMEIPSAADVGWYRLGPQPGDPGSSVLAAHIDYGGKPGAFFDLGAIPVGAEILVAGRGGERRFVVTAREQIAKADIDLSRYFTAEGSARLTLITCGGAFRAGSGHYEDNLVITAEPAP